MDALAPLFVVAIFMIICFE